MARCGRLVAVADILPERASRLAARYGARPYPSAEALLAAAPSDVVAVCTPNYLHAPQSILALEAGSHVLCEKPMCLSSPDAEAMIAAAARANRHLFIVKQNRFNPPIRLLQQLIAERQLGRIHSFQVNAIWNRPPAYYKDSPWHGQKDKDGGILFTQFSHFIDLLPWLLGDVAEVRSFRDNFQLRGLMDGEDTGVAILRMTSGAIGTLQYTVGSYAANMEGSLLVLGEKGTVRIGGQYLNELDYFQVDGIAAPALPLTRPANEYGFYQGSMSNHDKVYDELVKALRGEPYDLPSAVEAARTVALIEMILTASSNPTLPQ
jgi:UDP-N-acetyl-2-amino-2-deoxyglucuronate dehydrogenase